MKRAPRIAVVIAVVAVVVALVRLGWPRRRFDMAAELASIARSEGVWDNQWDQPAEKIASLASALGSETDPVKRFRLKRELANHYLYSGTPEGALAILEELQNEVGKTLPQSVAEAVKADLAFAYFRVGEVENCSQHHNADSCLFPIEGEGVHLRRLGASEAVKLYAELLADPHIERLFLGGAHPVRAVA